MIDSLKISEDDIAMIREALKRSKMRKNQKIRTAVSQLVSADRVMVRRDGSVEVRHSFFYRHGNNAELFSHQVVGKLPGAKVIGGYGVGYGETWRAWPKVSYWWVVIKIGDVDALLEKVDGLLNDVGQTWEEAYEEMAHNQS